MISRKIETEFRRFFAEDKRALLDAVFKFDLNGLM